MLNPNPHCVSNLTCHLIFVCKYRKPLLETYGDEIKNLCLECANNSTKFEIASMEVDKDHIHFMINYSTHETIKNIVKQLKSYTTFQIWENHENDLKPYFGNRECFGQIVNLLARLAILVEKQFNDTLKPKVENRKQFIHYAKASVVFFLVYL